MTSTSGWRRWAVSIPPAALSADPTTWMSGSNERSLVRFSTVRGASSTTTMRIVEEVSPGASCPAGSSPGVTY
jgi:hypothetical protein